MSTSSSYYRKSPLFYTWNRIQARPRGQHFNRSLRAEIHDPLWMLGRQWQMGEYRGEDTGSGIYARVQMEWSSIAGVSPYGATPQPYKAPYDVMPLEAVVESLPLQWSVKERVIIGKKWRSILLARRLWVSKYRAVFTLPVFSLQDEPASNASEDDVVKKAGESSDPLWSALYAAAYMSGILLDGGSLYQLLEDDTAWQQNLKDKLGTPNANYADLTDSRKDLLTWIQSIFVLPVKSNIQENGHTVTRVGHWNPGQLEYQLDTYWYAKDEMQQRRLYRLSAPSYAQGTLDWYALNNDPNLPTNTLSPADPTTRTLQVIMSEARFPGMPSNRWWEFENGSANYCNLDGNTTDIAKLVVTQFALVFQDDWFVIPHSVPMGSVTDIRGIVVTDVFGVKTFVPNHRVSGYTQANGFTVPVDVWKRWSWMDTSTVNPKIATDPKTVNRYRPLSKMVTLPTAPAVQQGAPLESVVFIRDEMANMVWAIESRIPNVMGQGVDGRNAAESLVTYLKNRKPAPAPAAPVAGAAPLSYQLVSQNMPENWIPFVAVSMTGNRKIKLRRATIKRALPPYADAGFIRPRTAILSYGLAAGTTYDVNEEEVPRSGTIVETSYQRARWHSGKTAVWIGREKRNGRGEGSSNLEYDIVKEMPTP